MDEPAPMADADFTVIADAAYIYVFRTSTNQTVYFDKFVFDQTIGKLVNATQVRYRRSRKADLPLDRRDTFGSKDMNDRLFLEPTTELDFLSGISPGRFAVAILPTELAGVTRWQFLAQDEASGKLISYSILRTPNGGFDLDDSMDPSTGQVLPDAEFELVSAQGATYSLASGPAMIRYDKQEWQTDEYGSVTLQKREVRVLVAIATGETGAIATLDFGIGNDGKLTVVGGSLTVGGAMVLQGALNFDPSVSSQVSIPAIATGAAATVETWIAPSTNPESGTVLISSADSEDVAFTLGLDGGVPYVLAPGGETVAGTDVVSVRNWTHVAAVFGSSTTLYVNGQPFTTDNGVTGARGTPPQSGYLFGGSEGLTGDLAAVRLWKVARTHEQILSTMSTIVTNSDAGWSDLVGYWQCNEPSDDKRFTTVPNSASTGAAADGVPSGASWVSSRAPATPSGTPVLFDDNGLTVVSGLLNYATTGATPCLYEGADSLVHLYYSAKGTQQASAAHFSPVVARSTYSAGWEAEDTITPDNTQTGVLSFVARLAGTAMNSIDPSTPFVAIAATNQDKCKVTLRSYTGYTEVWPNVPRAVESFVEVLNGLAAQLSDDPVQVDEDALMYDYAKVQVTAGGGQSGPAPQSGAGSSIFSVLIDALPDNGMTALVQAVSKTAPAPLERAGAGGCWLPYPPLLGIDMSDIGQFIQVISSTDIDNYTGTLLLDQDLTIEAWLDPISNQMNDCQTLFVFNKPGATEEDSCQYIVGLDQGVPYAGNGSIVNIANATVPLDTSWTHLAAAYRTNYGVQLGGARYLDAGNNENMKTADAVTIESWIRLDSLGVEQTIFSKTSPQDGTSWVLGIDASGKAVFKVIQSTQTGIVERTVTSSTGLTTGDWHHVAGVYDVAYERQVAIMFGQGSYVKIPQIASPPTEGVSVMMWVKRVVDDSNQQETLFTSIDPQSNMTFSLSLYKGVPQFTASYGTQQYKAKDTTTLRRDDWVHIAGTFDPNKGISLIIDGVLIENSLGASFPAFISDKQDALVDFEAEYAIGGFGSNLTFLGTVNEVSLWNRRLSLDEVRQKILQPLATTERGLCGYWRCNDLFGDTVMDLAGTANGLLAGGNFIRVDKGAFAQKVFVNGVAEVFDRVVDPIALSDARVTMGSGFYEHYLQGTISETRLWKSGRMNWQIDYFMDRPLEPNATGLISNWLFQTGKGSVSFDDKSDNNARIVDGKTDLTDEVIDSMWTVATFKAGWTFYINGSEVESLKGSLPPGGYGDAQANIGVFNLSGSLSRFYTGQISQIRIWDKLLTGQQVRGPMFTRLSGMEPGLAAFWGIDGGSGDLIADLSGWGNTGSWRGGPAPSWITLTAPVGIEEPALQSTPGDIARPENIKTEYAPSVGRYGQTQVDANGVMYASMLQTLSLVDASDGLLSMFSNFKVGNLILQFVGQAQVDPTLIGYIEGPPPLPAENLKLYPGDPLSYVGASTIMIDESNIKSYTYAAGRDIGSVIDMNTRIGFNVEGETSAGIGVQQEVFSFGFGGGLAVQLNETIGVVGEATASEELTVTAQKYLESRGSWYPNTYNIDKGVGDIFYPNNTGYALVRSGTADLYAMRIEGSGTLVGYTAEPNPDIPEDMNIIMFKIDDQYVKNGTLDGWIGFQPDTSYPNLQPGEHASYFKPLEAYAIKATIEREQQQRKAYFENFDAESIGQRTDAFKPDGLDIADTGQSLVNALIGVKDKAKLSVDEWREKMARRSMVNTYVWTAEGGLYAEQQQFMALREESSGGSYTMLTQAGIYTEFTVSVGPTFNLDAMFGTTITTQAHKTDHDSALFTMEVDLMGDQRYIGLVEDDQGDYLYTNDPSPGKVRGYRFMSFYRAPSKQNFESFKDGIVDRDWLNGQGKYAGKYDPDALALRSAMTNPNEVWRVMHRVTYVSRTPPATESEGQSLMIDVRKPDEASVISNLKMISELPTDLSANNPMQKVSDEADVLLAEMGANPVWGAALANKLSDHKEDIMKYMRSYYGIPS